MAVRRLINTIYLVLNKVKIRLSPEREVDTMMRVALGGHTPLFVNKSGGLLSLILILINFEYYYYISKGLLWIQ